MRVIHLDTGRELRGGQRQVLLLHRALLARGVDSLVVAPRGAPLGSLCREAGWPLVQLAGRRPWRPGVLSTLRRLVVGADVLHLHDPHAATLAAFAAGCAPPPLVVCHRRAGFPLRRGLIHRLKYRRVDRWIAVTGAIRADLVAWGVAPQWVRTVPSAIDLALVRAVAAGGSAAVRRDLGVPPEAPLIVAAGALDHQKGFAVLVRALARLSARRPGAHLVVVGEGPERAALERLAVNLGLGPHLHLVGRREDVPAVLAAAAVCVVPSLAAEGSSAVAKEAMAVGCPLLASELPGLVEVAGDAARWFPPADHEAVAVALGELLDDPAAARRRAEIGRERATSFGVAGLVEAVLAAYRDGLRQAVP